MKMNLSVMQATELDLYMSGKRLQNQLKSAPPAHLRCTSENPVVPRNHTRRDRISPYAENGVNNMPLL